MIRVETKKSLQLSKIIEDTDPSISNIMKRIKINSKKQQSNSMITMTMTSLTSITAMILTMSFIIIFSSPHSINAFQTTSRISLSLSSPTHSLSSSISQSFASSNHDRIKRLYYTKRSASISASASQYDDWEGDTSLGEKVRTVTVAYIDQLLDQQQLQQQQQQQAEAELEEDGSILTTTSTKQQQQRERIVLDVINGHPFYTYETTLPIVIQQQQQKQQQQQQQQQSTATSQDNSQLVSSSPYSTSSITATQVIDITQTLGITLAELQKDEQGYYILSETGLEMDTLRYISLQEQSLSDQKQQKEQEQQQKIQSSVLIDNDNDIIGSIQLFDEKKSDIIGAGVVVSRIVRGSIAWNAGIRAGDKIVATSATMGDKMWPKSTLDGIRSAISSRKVMTSTMKFQFQRSCDNLISETELVQEFELSLSRPMGIHIEDTPDGYVQISGFTDDAPQLVKDKLKVGDRIIAVDSSLGSNLWPISNVEGAVSAVTTRLPGQPVRLRFERLVQKGTDLANIKSLNNDKKSKNQSLTKDLLSTYTKFQAKEQKDENMQLLSRCRDVLKRYIYVYDRNNERSAGVPALVADRVLESLADASASLDAKTLSLVMNAYMVCKQPQEALRIFEASVGLAADGSTRLVDQVVKGKTGGQIVVSEKGLNLFTATDLIRAHSQTGDLSAARRVLAAMEGDNAIINGISASNWNTQYKADTKCYNSILAAVANSKVPDLGFAEELYGTMCEPVIFNTPRPKKTVVTYNTMINIYSKCGRRNEAFALLNEMLDAGLKPDKFTITSLVNTVVADGDIETALNLLNEMKKAGIKADVVGYNTVIKALCDKSQWFEAKTLVAEMEARGVKPDGKTYGLLMNGLLKLNKPGPCLTLFESACADQNTAPLMENVQLYTTAITAAATLGDYERALELVSRMTFAGVKPNMKTLTSLMGACITGENYGYALDVYKKISNPDGYAMMLGIRAQSKVGDFDTALSMVDKNKDMTGKQIMSSYNYIITCALEAKNFDAAKEAMSNLIGNNFIPSKETLKAVLVSLDLLMNKSKKAKSFGNPSNDDKLEDIEAFKYLLYVLDLLEQRKLHSTAQFYSCLLFEGARLGGLYKKIASIIQSTRTDSLQLKVHVSDEEPSNSLKLVGWIDLIENYSEYRDRLDQMTLPPVLVRTNEKEIRLVLSAEQSVTYNAIRKRKKKLPQIKR